MKKTYLDMDRRLRKGGYTLTRWKGSHAIYQNGHHTVAVNIKPDERVAPPSAKGCGLDG